MSGDSGLHVVIESLAKCDEVSRAARAGRLRWIATVDTRPPAYMGPVDTLRVMREAHDCFVNGHFVAALVLSTAFVEHTLFDELLELGLVTDGEIISLARVIKLSRANLVMLPDDLLDRADQVREYRNPFAHRRKSDDSNTLYNRYVAAGMHPDAVMEADARLALGVMYELFERTLRG